MLMCFRCGHLRCCVRGVVCQAKRRLQDSNLRLVGWYHAHTDFRADPTTQDVLVQQALQHQFKDTTSVMEPFVGLIVSPYNPR